MLSGSQHVSHFKKKTLCRKVANYCVWCFLLKGQARRFPEDQEAQAAPAHQHLPMENDRVIYWWMRCFHNVHFLNNTVCFTLGPGRPIPVSPWIPGGPGSPLSPYKNKYTCKAQTPYFITDLCIFSLCCICSLVPPTPHLNTCFSYMQSLTIFKEALNMYYRILSLLQT